MPPPIVIAFLIIVVLAVLALIIWNVDKRKHEKFVQAHSVTLKALRVLNDKYKFWDVLPCDMVYVYDNEHFFEQIECRDYLIYQLQFKEREIIEQINKSAQNEISYARYRNELSRITRLGVYDVPYGRLRKGALLEFEKREYNQIRLKPCTPFNLRVTLYCSRMNGYIYAEKSDVFYENDIRALVRRLNNKRGTYFNDKDIWRAISTVERGKVSNKMRFAIYERDGYRCCKCGVSDRNATLEVDHIIPISKGGKSTFDNLQTLCHRCNVEKGDTIPYYSQKHYY